MRTLTVAIALLCVVAADFAFADEPRPSDDLEQARKRHAQTVKNLDDALAEAQRAHAAAIDAANRTLLATLDKAIDDARLRKDAATLARLKAERSRIKASTPMPIDSLRGDAVFECVLGVYSRSLRGEQYPFINLRPPTEANLWNDGLKKTLAGKVDFAGIEYIGTAKLIAPRDGWYTLHAKPGTAVRLNEQQLQANSHIHLRQGVYDVEIHAHTWGGPYINYAYAYFTAKDDNKRLPLVNTGDAMERFVEQRIGGRKVTEVTGYQPKAVDLDVRGPKGKVTVPAPAKKADRFEQSAVPLELLEQLRTE